MKREYPMSKIILSLAVIFVLGFFGLQVMTQGPSFQGPIQAPTQGDKDFKCSEGTVIDNLFNFIRNNDGANDVGCKSVQDVELQLRDIDVTCGAGLSINRITWDSTSNQLRVLCANVAENFGEPIPDCADGTFLTKQGGVLTCVSLGTEYPTPTITCTETQLLQWNGNRFCM